MKQVLQIAVTSCLLIFVTTTASRASFNIGDLIRANQTLNVRSSPGGSLIGQHVLADQGKITAGPVYASYNGTYYKKPLKNIHELTGKTI